VSARVTTAGVNGPLVPLGYVPPALTQPSPTTPVPPSATPAPSGSPQSGVSSSTHTAPAAGRVVLLSAQVPVTRSGFASLRLQCRGAGSCQAHLKLLATRTVVSHGRRKHESVVIGTLGLGLAAGHRSVERVHLTTEGRSLLGAGHGALLAKLSISSPQTAATARTTVATVDLHENRS